MQTAIAKVLTILNADNSLKTLLGATAGNPKIYPALSPQFESFPCITYEEINGPFRSVPRGAQDTTLQLDFYSKTSKQNTEDVYTKVNELLNYYTDSDQLIQYIKQVMVTDVNDTDRKLWHKVARYQIWIVN